jgi:diguanylate cyclase (GGDEF)-like protein
MPGIVSTLRNAALLAILSLCALSASAASHSPINAVSQLVSISNDEAAQKITVRFEATVTFPRPSEKNLFVMDGDLGCYVRWPVDQGLLPGDRVTVTGYTAPSFRPIVVAQTVTFLHHGQMPPARPATFADLIQSKWDARRVLVTGRVLSAALDDSKLYHSLRIRVKVLDGTVEGFVAHAGKLGPEDLLDADVRMAGIAGGEFDSKMQMAGIWLDMNSWEDLVILHRPAADPWSVPAVAMTDVIGDYRFSNQSSRVRIVGTLTYYEPGALAVLQQDHGLSMLVRTNTTLPMHTGNPVEATGFPGVTDEMVRLENAQLRPIAPIPPAQPSSVHWEQASVGKYAYDLVSMEGEVVGVVHDSRVDLFIILSEGHLFSATLRHASSDVASLPNFTAPTIPIGSRVRVTGVCFVDAGNHWRDRLWFDLRMRSLDDIVTLQPPSWWTVKRLAWIVSFLLFAILIAVLWVGWLDRRLRAKTAALALQSQEDAVRERAFARQEQQRSHILELISSSVPLNEVLLEIESMVSSRLSGVPCWFELGLLAGNSSEPERRSEPVVVSRELVSHEGLSLGFLLARPQWVNDTPTDIDAALTAGARLAELAIETRRLYSDLRHRSEHDLLTDIPNRFSMESHLDRLMARAARNEGLFGLVYVDLDRFKQVNDRYGHRIGDLYLQEVTRRMKLQLRTNDVLARIGGDEFIALVPILRSRTDAEEIAIRLERCFDEPFQLGGHLIDGSASIGLAIYPEDGASQEALQHAADAAMYAHKQSKRSREQLARSQN